LKGNMLPRHSFDIDIIRKGENPITTTLSVEMYIKSAGPAYKQLFRFEDKPEDTPN
jgi:hypothetical protein